MIGNIRHMSIPVQVTDRLRWSDLITLTRPWYLPVALAPYVGGRFLAGHRGEVGIESLRQLISTPILWSGAVALALTWCAVAIMNDAYDQATDERNPRREATTETVRRWGVARLLRLTGLVAAAAVTASAVGASVVLTVGVVAMLILGWAYSAPPVRLKQRPGLDVLSNAVPVGVLAPLAGWATAAPMAQFPWQLGGLGVLTVAALYLPTLMIDAPSDRAAGIRTTAVVLGLRLTYRIGVLLWASASTACLLLLITGTLLPFRLQWPDLLGWVVVVISYPILIRRPSIRRLVVVSGLLLGHGVLLIS